MSAPRIDDDVRAIYDAVFRPRNDVVVAVCIDDISRIYDIDDDTEPGVKSGSGYSRSQLGVVSTMHVITCNLIQLSNSLTRIGRRQTQGGAWIKGLHTVCRLLRSYRAYN
jgi:hypothetical protein